MGFKKDINYDWNSLCNFSNLLVSLHDFFDATLKPKRTSQQVCNKTQTKTICNVKNCLTHRWKTSVVFFLLAWHGHKWIKDLLKGTLVKTLTPVECCYLKRNNPGYTKQERRTWEHKTQTQQQRSRFLGIKTGN